MEGWAGKGIVYGYIDLSHNLPKAGKVRTEVELEVLSSTAPPPSALLRLLL
jgi:hypothetical protein